MRTDFYFTNIRIVIFKHVDKYVYDPYVEGLEA